MNIFEQYGIKEVADVTFYEITYDKYGNEVYVPILYFDTLKVSSVEQAAQQTSAKGGLGNAEHIIWDYGKEITIELEDALYTPASQSLLWGGGKNIKKARIKGFFDPFVYNNDRFGNPIYVEKHIDPMPPEQTFATVLCPCEEGERYVYYTVAAHQYKHIIEHNSQEYGTLEEDGKFSATNITRNDKEILTEWGQSYPIYNWSTFKNKKYDKNGNEVEEITINNINDMPDLLDRAELIITNYDNFLCNKFQITEDDNNFYFGSYQDNYNIPDFKMIEYRWTNCELKLVGLSGDYQYGITDNTTVCWHSFLDNNNKRIIFNQNTLRGEYYSSLDFYLQIKKKIRDINGEDVILTIPVPIGTFYIVEDFNIPNVSEEYATDTLSYKINDAKLIERMEECAAFQCFAIDVDKNIKSYNCSFLPEYKQKDLTVYYNPETNKPYEANDHYFTNKNGKQLSGNFYIFKPQEKYLRWTRRRAKENEALGRQIQVNSKSFPGTFKVVGETWIRDRLGFDERYQIEIPLCKLSPNTNISLSADGGPTVVNMSLRALALEDGTFMKLTSYKTEKAKFDNNCSNSTEIVPFDILEVITCAFYEDTTLIPSLLYPLANEVYCVGKDCRIATSSYTTDGQSYTYLRLPTPAEAEELLNSSNRENWWNNHREILVIALSDKNGNIKQFVDNTMVNETELTITFGSDM